VRIRTKEQYDQRFAKRGEKTRNRTRTNDYLTEVRAFYGPTKTGEIIGHGTRPNHQERTVDIRGSSERLDPRSWPARSS
jgi:hypothetical protein